MLEFASLSFHEVPTERSEGEAQSPSYGSLFTITNLLLGEVRMERSDRQISNRTMREGVVFPANEVSGWKQAFIVIGILQNIAQN